MKKMRSEFGSNVRFVLMNSFSTSADTRAHLSQTHPDLVAEDGWELVQNKSPKVDAATMAPAAAPGMADMEWSAPAAPVVLLCMVCARACLSQPRWLCGAHSCSPDMEWSAPTAPVVPLCISCVHQLCVWLQGKGALSRHGVRG